MPREGAAHAYSSAGVSLRSVAGPAAGVGVGACMSSATATVTLGGVLTEAGVAGAEVELVVVALIAVEVVEKECGGKRVMMGVTLGRMSC